MTSCNLTPSVPADSPRDSPRGVPRRGAGRVAVVLAASLLVLLLGGCESRGDLLSVELVVFAVGEWVGVGPQGEELRFLLERDDDEAVLTAIIVSLPGLADLLQGDPDACGALTGAFSQFGNLDMNVRVRGGGFRFRTPNDVRFDNDGLIEAEIVGRFDAPDSATVDADIEIDATRFFPCRGEFTVSWQMEPAGS